MTADNRPWLCALNKDDETWEWGGATMEDAISAGFGVWGADSARQQEYWRVAGFWVAPAHKSQSDNADDCDPEEAEYTVESQHAQWIPFE